jgi:cell division inhibitor SepF
MCQRRRPARLRDNQPVSLVKNTAEQQPTPPLGKVQSMQTAPGAMEVPFGNWSPEVVVFTPSCFEDATEAVLAVQHLKTVVLHLDALEPQEAQRIIDFVSGGVYAIDGQSERLGDSVFLFAPSIVSISRDHPEISPPDL